MVGPKAHRSFMGHLLGIPVKPTSSRPFPVFILLAPYDSTLATPCASLHHSLVHWNGSGSGGYNIFLEDSFSSAVDHGIVAPRCAGTSATWQLQFVLCKAPFTRPLLLNSEANEIRHCFADRAVPRFEMPDKRVSYVCINVMLWKYHLTAAIYLVFTTLYCTL